MTTTATIAPAAPTQGVLLDLLGAPSVEAMPLSARPWVLVARTNAGERGIVVGPQPYEAAYDMVMSWNTGAHPATGVFYGARPATQAEVDDAAAYERQLADEHAVWAARWAA